MNRETIAWPWNRRTPTRTAARVAVTLGWLGHHFLKAWKARRSKIPAMSSMPTGAMATTSRSMRSLSPAATLPPAKAATMVWPCRWMEAHSAGMRIGAMTAMPPKLKAKNTTVTTDQTLMATLARGLSSWSRALVTGSGRRTVLRSTGPR